MSGKTLHVATPKCRFRFGTDSACALLHPSFLTPVYPGPVLKVIKLAATFAAPVTIASLDPMTSVADHDVHSDAKGIKSGFENNLQCIVHDCDERRE